MPPIGIEYVFFHYQDQQKQWKCIEVFTQSGDQKKYLKGQHYSLYHLPSLLRLLCMKNNCLSEHLSQQLYRQQETEQVCRIINWRQMDRKIVVAHWLRQKLPEDLPIIQQFLQDQKKLEQLFQQLMAGGGQ